MRKLAAIALMLLGLIVLAVAATVLVQHRLSLPALSAQTEGQWTAYRLHRWAFLLGESPLALGIFLIGYLLWPGRLVSDALVRPLAVVGGLVALAAVSALGFVVWSAVQYREPFLQAPWLAVQGGTLLGGLAVLVALALHQLNRSPERAKMESPVKTDVKNDEEVGNE